MECYSHARIDHSVPLLGYLESTSTPTDLKSQYVPWNPETQFGLMKNPHSPTSTTSSPHEIHQFQSVQAVQAPQRTRAVEAREAMPRAVRRNTKPGRRNSGVEKWWVFMVTVNGGFMVNIGQHKRW